MFPSRTARFSPGVFGAAVRALGLLSLVALLGGCAGGAPPSPGSPGKQADADGEPVAVRIEFDRGDVAPAMLSIVEEVVPGLLEVRLNRSTPVYDPATEQARFPYWLRLRNTRARTRTDDHMYTVHLTHLERGVMNGLERVTREDLPRQVTSVQEFKLDVLRADLHLGAGAHDALWFPCAEVVNPPRPATERVRSGTYTVYRRYTGDVTIRPARARTTRESPPHFVPVRVSFLLQFDLREARRRPTARRQLEWARISNRCETCRPVVTCEALAHPDRFPPETRGTVPHAVWNPGGRPAPDVHVVAGLEKRSTGLLAHEAEHARTVACTTWVPPAGGAPPDVAECWKGVDGALPLDGRLRVRTDGTEQGIHPATPYLVFHHAVPTRCLRRGQWTVQLRLAEDAGPTQGTAPGAGPPGGRVDVCDLGGKPDAPDWEVEIEVP